MATVTYYGHGVYCYVCDAVYESTDDCEHTLDRKAGVRKTRVDGYVAKPDDMGHRSPHVYMDIGGREQCAECDQVKLDADEVFADV